MEDERQTDMKIETSGETKCETGIKTKMKEMDKNEQRLENRVNFISNIRSVTTGSQTYANERLFTDINKNWQTHTWWV